MGDLSAFNREPTINQSPHCCQAALRSTRSLARLASQGPATGDAYHGHLALKVKVTVSVSWAATVTVFTISPKIGCHA